MENEIYLLTFVRVKPDMFENCSFSGEVIWNNGFDSFLLISAKDNYLHMKKCLYKKLPFYPIKEVQLIKPKR